VGTSDLLEGVTNFGARASPLMSARRRPRLLEPQSSGHRSIYGPACGRVMRASDNETAAVYISAQAARLSRRLASVAGRETSLTTELYQAKEPYQGPYNPVRSVTFSCMVNGALGHYQFRRARRPELAIS
jgi:hypothetical protein